MRFLNSSQGPMSRNVIFEGGDEAELWLRKEIGISLFEEMINSARRRIGLGSKLLTVEHGWNPKKSFFGSCVESARQDIKKATATP